MTRTRSSTYVVAATDGSHGARAAVGYAAGEARTRGLPLEIVTVMPAYLPAGPFPVAPDASMRSTHVTRRSSPWGPLLTVWPSASGPGPR